MQGTVCLVLRKRLDGPNARSMEIEAEIEDAVAAQLARLNALDDSWHERGGAETLYTDGDLTLAAYAAALQVVTAYATIDRQPLDRDLYRKLAKNERTMLRELVDYAARVANALLVPEGFPRPLWRDLLAPERFYVRMLDMEAQGSAKVARGAAQRPGVTPCRRRAISRNRCCASVPMFNRNGARRWSRHRSAACAAGRPHRFWGEVVDPRDGRTRYLRVVTLEDGVTVHNAFFDRDFDGASP